MQQDGYLALWRIRKGQPSCIVEDEQGSSGCAQEVRNRVKKALTFFPQEPFLCLGRFSFATPFIRRKRKSFKDCGTGNALEKNDFLFCFAKSQQKFFQESVHKKSGQALDQQLAHLNYRTCRMHDLNFLEVSAFQRFYMKNVDSVSFLALISGRSILFAVLSKKKIFYIQSVKKPSDKKSVLREVKDTFFYLMRNHRALLKKEGVVLKKTVVFLRRGNREASQQPLEIFFSHKNDFSTIILDKKSFHTHVFQVGRMAYYVTRIKSPCSPANKDLFSCSTIFFVQCAYRFFVGCGFLIFVVLGICHILLHIEATSLHKEEKGLLRSLNVFSVSARSICSRNKPDKRYVSSKLLFSIFQIFEKQVNLENLQWTFLEPQTSFLRFQMTVQKKCGTEQIATLIERLRVKILGIFNKTNLQFLDVLEIHNIPAPHVSSNPCILVTLKWR